MTRSVSICLLVILLVPAAARAERTWWPDADYYKFTRADMRLCPSPLCGGIFVKAVNRLLTGCPDGTLRFDCYVASVDLSALGMSEGEAAAFLAGFSQRLGIIKGRLRPLSFGGMDGLAELVAEEAWQAQGPKNLFGFSYLFRDLGIRCITAPCLSIGEEKLNSRRERAVAGLDLSPSGATQQEIAAGQESLFTTGLIASGTHRRISGPGGTGLEFAATQFYMKVGASPEACGGLQGTPCPEGLFCDIAVPNACSGADLSGVCKAVPEACTTDYSPVCGCDGITYSNDCTRLSARVQLDHQGECLAKGQ